jgi:hypothetical protein
VLLLTCVYGLRFLVKHGDELRKLSPCRACLQALKACRLEQAQAIGGALGKPFVVEGAQHAANRLVANRQQGREVALQEVGGNRGVGQLRLQRPGERAQQTRDLGRGAASTARVSQALDALERPGRGSGATLRSVARNRG